MRMSRKWSVKFDIEFDIEGLKFVRDSLLKNSKEKYIYRDILPDRYRYIDLVDELNILIVFRFFKSIESIRLTGLKRFLMHKLRISEVIVGQEASIKIEKRLERMITRFFKEIRIYLAEYNSIKINKDQIMKGTQ
jgi:hypothetical protein